MEKMRTFGIIVAMPEERRALQARADRIKKRIIDSVPLYEGIIEGKKVCIAEAGMGVVAATRAARILTVEAEPAMLISAGFCGAVRDGATVADIVVCGQLFSLDENGLNQISLPGSELIATRLSAELQGKGVRAWHGSFITAALIISKSEISLRLPEQIKTPVLEMESSAVALAAAAAGIPFLGLRAVTDPADEELDFSLSELCDEQLRISIMRVILSCIKKPRIIPQLARLASNSSKAQKSLGRAVELIMPIL